MIQIKFDLRFGDFVNSLPNSAVRATIHNSAKDARGFHYFHRVDEGRGPVRPVRAKMLRWQSVRYPQGAFRKFSRPAPARNIRGQAMRSAAPEIQAIAAQSGSSRTAVVATVNRVATRLVLYLLRFTPIGLRGRLRNSYWVESAQ